MTWLDNILEQHKEMESPQNYWRWAALASVSAIIKDNVWMNRHKYELYPNIYVILHGDSGIKKGPPINMAKKLVRLADPTHRVISGRWSIQGVLKDLGTARTLPGGKINKSSAAFICSSELTSAIVGDPAAMEILTDLFDRGYNDGKWESLLKMDQFQLTNPIVTWISGTNDAHSQAFFESKDLFGGFFARTFVVLEKKRNTLNSLMDKPENETDNEKNAQYLKLLMDLKGPFEATGTDTPVGRYYNDWYMDFYRQVDITKAEDPTGTINRFGDSVLKVAMLYSLIEEPALRITMKAMETSIEQCTKLIGNVRRTTNNNGRSTWAHHKAMVINELLEREPHIISRTQLNKKYYLHGNSDEWDNVMKSLFDAGIVVVENPGGVTMYRMPDHIVDEWRKHFEGRMNK